jgi:hypothetical protein
MSVFPFHSSFLGKDQNFIIRHSDSKKENGQLGRHGSFHFAHTAREDLFYIRAYMLFLFYSCSDSDSCFTLVRTLFFTSFWSEVRNRHSLLPSYTTGVFGGKHWIEHSHEHSLSIAPKFICILHRNFSFDIASLILSDSSTIPFLLRRFLGIARSF